MNQQPVICSRKSAPDLGRRGDDGLRCPSRRLILALDGLPQTAVLERYFQERGWKVHVTGSSGEARTLARKLGASALLLAEQSNREESGWLTCWKLLRDRPKLKVIIVGNRPVEEGRRLAQFVGAASYVAATETALAIAGALKAAGL